MNILVVDDDEIDRFWISELIKLQGAEAVACQSGSEAIDRIDKDPNGFDLAFVDIHMPDMNGEQVLQVIRARFCRQSMPVLAITTDLDWLMQEQHLRKGFNGACLKPLDHHQVLQAIQVHA
jgi:CheY-like chemotaxis protein